MEKILHALRVFLLIGVSVNILSADDALAKKSGCLDCHSINKNMIGPAFRQIAVKYKETTDVRDTLIEKIKKGGKGNWTSITRGVPMPPHDQRLTSAEIGQLVDWIRALP